MKYLLLLVLASTASVAEARSWQADYPSCTVHRQQQSKSGTGRGANQAHIQMRANILQADLATASKAQRISKQRSKLLWNRVDAIRNASNTSNAKRGYIGAVEKASFDRKLDEIALQLCRR